MKWYYGIDPIQALCGSTRKNLYHDRCAPLEADFWIPINHVEYARTEKEARRKFGLGDDWYEVEYRNDPDYPIDWVEGDFA